MKTMMTKMYVSAESTLRSAGKKIVEALKNDQGLTTVEWAFLMIVVAGLVLLMKPLISATFTKVAGLWDTEVVNKFNGAK